MKTYLVRGKSKPFMAFRKHLLPGGLRELPSRAIPGLDALLTCRDAQSKPPHCSGTVGGRVLKPGRHQRIKGFLRCSLVEAKRTLLPQVGKLPQSCKESLSFFSRGYRDLCPQLKESKQFRRKNIHDNKQESNQRMYVTCQCPSTSATISTGALSYSIIPCRAAFSRKNGHPQLDSKALL